MEQYTIFIIIFGIIIFLVLGLLCLFNNILLKRQKVNFQFMSIIKIIEERILLFDKIDKFIKKNCENEKKYLDDINKLLSKLDEINSSTKESITQIKQSNSLLYKFIELKQTYSQLNKNKEYNQLVEQISLNEERLEYAFDIYNKEVEVFNRIKNTKVNLIVSKIFKIKDYECYEK